MGDAEQRVVIVTGGASGIGRAICEEMARGGWRVAVADINDEAAAKTAGAMEERGAVVRGVHVDITSLESAETMVSVVKELWGRVDALVNCAGWDRFQFFLDNEPALWDRLIAINLRGTIHCTRAVLPLMKEQGSGSIVNIASDAGRVGSLGESVYSACKGGVIAFTKTIAREMARFNVRANCVCPGPTETPLLSEFLPKEMEEKILKAYVRATPLGRLGRPDDAAPAVAFMCGDGAGFITGQTLSVSGGLSMHG